MGLQEVLDEDLPELRKVTDELADVLGRFDGLLIRGDVDYEQHRRFALRARTLGLHFAAVHKLLDESLYPSSFSVMRTCLEHHLLDLLMMLGYRYVQVFEGLTDEQWGSLMKTYEEGGAGSESIVEEPTRSNKGHVRIVREGLYPKKADGDSEDYALPLTFFVVSDYSPFVGRPSDQDEFHDGLTDVELPRENAKKHREMYQQHLRWSSLRDSLELNGFYKDRDLVALDVHYRFLSAFVHGTQEAYDIAYPRGLLYGSPPIYDHYSHELVLLYLLVIGSLELDALLQMSDQRPAIEVSKRHEIEQLIERATELSDHLWFPGSEPHRLDRIREANHRSWESYREIGSLTPVNPDEIDADDVGYYQNPMARLALLHSSHSEVTTGLSFASDWERSDAQQRVR